MRSARREAALKAHATRRRKAGARRAAETRKGGTSTRGLAPADPVEVAVVRSARAALVRARARGLPWSPDLPKEMLLRCREQGACCALSGVPFSLEVRGHGAAPRPFAPSIDRIDSAGGYTVDNCRLVAWAVNIFCGVWGSEDAQRLAEGMARRGPEKGAQAG